jgi:hypothetical protein
MREGKYTKPLNMVIRPDMYQYIKSISDQRRISMGEYCREILEQHFTTAVHEEGRHGEILGL